MLYTKQGSLCACISEDGISYMGFESWGEDRMLSHVETLSRIGHNGVDEQYIRQQQAHVSYTSI